MKKMGRPKTQIDKRQFELLCNIQCTEEEVCAVLGGSNGPISPHTLNRWCREEYGSGNTFCKVFEQKKLEGKTSLRRMQWLMASRSPAMAIFLGKNYLGQRDDPIDNGDAEDAVSIVDDVPNVEVKSHADQY